MQIIISNIKRMVSYQENGNLRKFKSEVIVLDIDHMNILAEQLSDFLKHRNIIADIKVEV
jgi:hypothetical protein